MWWERPRDLNDVRERWCDRICWRSDRNDSTLGEACGAVLAPMGGLRPVPKPSWASGSVDGMLAMDVDDWDDEWDDVDSVDVCDGLDDSWEITVVWLVSSFFWF